MKHPEHRLICKSILGKSYPQVDRALDYPVRWLGRRHRILFHNWWQAIIIGTLVAGISGALAALIHITVDWFSPLFNYIIKLLK